VSLRFSGHVVRIPQDRRGASDQMRNRCLEPRVSFWFVCIEWSDVVYIIKQTLLLYKESMLKK